MFESAVEMARSALEELGDSLEEIDRTEAFYRDNDAERLGMQKDEGDMYAGSDRMITQAARDARHNP
jgi:glutathione-regulated potassium-efflux system protein KefB